MVGMRSMRRIGRAYVRPVERFTPARKAETMRVVSFAARFGEELGKIGIGLLSTASNAM
jgi:hypothetical protein